jgi:hypothetical protein
MIVSIDFMHMGIIPHLLIKIIIVTRCIYG